MKKPIRLMTVLLVVFTTFALLSSCINRGNNDDPGDADNLSMERRYIATVFGEGIPESYFRFNLLGLQMEFEQQYGIDIWDWDFGELSLINFVKQEALNSMLSARIAAITAERLGIADLSEDDENILALWIDIFLADIMFEPVLGEWLGLTDDDLQLVFRDGIIIDKLFDHVVEEMFVFDETAAAAAFSSFIEEHNDDLTTYGFFVLLHYGLEYIEAVYAELVGGVDFFELMAEHCLIYDPSFSLADNMFVERGGGLDWYGPEFLEAILALEVGEVSGIVPILDWAGEVESYIIIFLFDIEVVDPETIFDEFIELIFIPEQQDLLFLYMLEIWVEEANIEINEEVLADNDIFAW